MFKKKRFWIFTIYVALLAASFGVRMLAEPNAPSSDKKFLDVSIDGSPAVRIAYKESGEVDQKQTPVIMIHGSPGSAGAFDGLVGKLPGRHIVSVDLPGFGDSERSIPDYSIEAHSRYLSSFLQKKGIENAHFVGFSLGGGVILHLSDSEPQLVQSLTFIASIGVQEYELFGDYYVNHAVHGLQLGFAWALRELVPHFGLFDGGMIEYARNFYDTDQRPLRGMLAKHKGPLLILHGKDDPLVPVEAAREHARIVPQSEYHELDDNHFFVFMRPETISQRMNEFWDRVESGEAIVRDKARSDRMNAAAAPFVFEIIPARGPVVVCFFLLLLFAAFLNEDIAALLAGVFVAQGRLGFAMPLIAIVIAMIISSIFWRRIGRRQRGITMSTSFPFSVGAQKADAFGFRFLDFIKRSRDSFFHFVGVALGLGLLRMLVLGGVVFLIIKGLTYGGLIANSNTLNLLGLALIIYVVKILIFTFLRKERRGH